jgi:hypothetical protein
MCQLLDSNYAGATSGLVPAGCPTAEEKLRQDCLTTPQGPDDKPRPECLRQLSPPGDLHTWQTRICDKVKCFPGLVMKTTDDGSCNCVATPMPDIGQGLPCRLGTVMLCDGSGVDESCGCPTFTRTGPGPVPIGNDPLCRYQTDDASWPGNLDGFTVLSPNDVFMHQHTATERFAMIKPNRTLISPTIYRNTVSAVPATGTSNPAKLRVKTLLTKAPPAGSNVTLQIYATSKDLPAGTQPLLNQLIGQASLNALTPGTPTNVDIALDQTLIDRAFSGGSFRLGYYISATGGGATRYVGVGSQQFIGNNTPLASPMPICPRPDPTNGLATIALYNPLSIATGGTPTVWAPYIISGVTLGLTPDRIQVVRSLTPVP